MRNHIDGGPAYPTGQFHEGMALRDYFAARAMAHWHFNLHENCAPEKMAKIANECYALADAMLKARMEGTA